MTRTRMVLLSSFLSLSLALMMTKSTAFLPASSRSKIVSGAVHQTTAFSSAPSTSSSSGEEMVRTTNKPSDEWELDCYSRPVLINGKKLWEVLITDATGSFRYCKTLPSNQVNSKELRAVVDKLMDDADVKPSTIRFFRGAMFNMINIALKELDVVGKPSRCTNSLAQWLEERHRDVYPRMEGFRKTMVVGDGNPAFLNMRVPVKLPDALRGEKYAFVSLPLAEFREGGGVNEDNIGVGRLCAIDPSLPADAFVQGVVILTNRAKALASWLAGTEVAAVTADLRKRNLIMEAKIDTQYLMAKLDDQQRVEGTAFEEGKDALNGLHFVCVQEDDDSDPEGFWLLRGIPSGI